MRGLFQFDLYRAAVYQAICFPKLNVGGNLNNFDGMRSLAGLFFVGPQNECSPAKQRAGHQIDTHGAAILCCFQAQRIRWYMIRLIETHIECAWNQCEASLSPVIVVQLGNPLRKVTLSTTDFADEFPHVAERRVQPRRAKSDRKQTRRRPGVGCHDWFGVLTIFSMRPLVTMSDTRGYFCLKSASVSGPVMDCFATSIIIQPSGSPR